MLKMTPKEIEKFSLKIYTLEELRKAYRKDKTIFFKIRGAWIEHVGDKFPVNNKLKYKLVELESK